MATVKLTLDDHPAGIDPPEPSLTVQEMMARAEALRPVLRERQAQCEEGGRLPEQTNEDFIRAGFYRIVQPRRFGGYEFSLVDFIRVMTEVSRGCAESGWVLALTAGHPAAFLSGLPEEGQKEVYGALGDVRVPAVALPGGTAVPAGDGYLVNGAWDYSSGCDIATHFLGASIAIDPTTQKPRALVYVLLDREMFSIVDNWSMVGMQGTGSRRVVVNGVNLPQYRVLEFSDMELTRTFDQPGRALHLNPLYHGPVLPFLFTELAAVAVGAGKGGLDIYDEILRSKKSPLPPFRARVDSEEFQRHFGEAQGLIDTAEAALLHLGAIYPEFGRRRMKGVSPSLEEERRFQRVAQQCVDLVWQAMDLMFRTSGTSATRKTSQLARYFRNLAVIRTHITLQAEHTSTNIGRLHFGIPPLSTL